MRLLRKLVVPVVLCLILGAVPASAVESPAGREVRDMARVLGHLQALLRAVWDYEGWEIDPWGGNAPGSTGDQPANPGTDEGFEIDPLG